MSTESAIQSEFSVSLAECSTFRLGGACPRLVCCENAKELREAVSALSAAKEPFVLIGGGSNLLISDAGLPGTVLRYAGHDLAVRESGPGQFIVDGSVSLDELAAWSAANGLDGLNCCTGIPGTVAGAVVGNAGAWGKQIGDVIVSVTLMDRSGKTRIVDPGELNFSYRNSALKRSSDIVVDVSLNLRKGNAGELNLERDRILKTRAEKHPDLDQDPCIGSIFRNIEPTSAAGRRQAAGWFLEQAGAKEMRVGGARVFDRHANIIIKGPGCTAQNVRDLAVLMKDAVLDEFGIELVREVRYLGVFEGETITGWNAFL
jgi:UDP-N-acetylmuramate dehydrogenase